MSRALSPLPKASEFCFCVWASKEFHSDNANKRNMQLAFVGTTAFPCYTSICTGTVRPVEKVASSTLGLDTCRMCLHCFEAPYCTPAYVTHAVYTHGFSTYVSAQSAWECLYAKKIRIAMCWTGKKKWNTEYATKRFIFQNILRGRKCFLNYRIVAPIWWAATIYTDPKYSIRIKLTWHESEKQ